MTTTEQAQTARAALTYLREHPEKHDQATWVDAPGSDGPEVFMTEDGYASGHTAEDINLCDTTMCVAGTVQFQHYGYVAPATAAHDAAHFLGLDDEQARFLFYDATNEGALVALEHIANGDPWALNDQIDDFYRDRTSW